MNEPHTIQGRPILEIHETTTTDGEDTFSVYVTATPDSERPKYYAADEQLFDLWTDLFGGSVDGGASTSTLCYVRCCNAAELEKFFA